MFGTSRPKIAMLCKGEIGVMRSGDQTELYRVRFVGNGLIKIERLVDGFTRWLYPRDFQVLPDGLYSE